MYALILQDHFFQGGFTLVASGMKDLATCIRSSAPLISKKAVLFRNRVVELCPARNSIVLEFVFKFVKKIV